MRAGHNSPFVLLNPHPRPFPRQQGKGEKRVLFPLSVDGEGVRGRGSDERIEFKTIYDHLSIRLDAARGRCFCLSAAIGFLDLRELIRIPIRRIQRVGCNRILLVRWTTMIPGTR